MTRGEMLNLLTKEAKEYHRKALSFIKRNKRMNNLSLADFAKLKKNKKLMQKVVDAVIVDFINSIGINQGIDYALYTKHLYE